MLSQHDRRTLAAIEERLSAEAPDLARLLVRFDQWAPEQRGSRHRVAWCTVGLGLALLAVAFALRSADVLFVSVMLLAVALVRWAVIVVHALARRHSAPTRIER